MFDSFGLFSLTSCLTFSPLLFGHSDIDFAIQVVFLFVCLQHAKKVKVLYLKKVNTVSHLKRRISSISTTVFCLFSYVQSTLNAFQLH